MSTIRIEGAEDLIKKLTSLEQMRMVKAAVFEATSMLRDQIVKYPPEAGSHRPNPMLSGNSDRARRMRAGFFYRLNEGLIDVPYKRGQSRNSKGLDKGWTIRMQNQGFRGVVGNSVSYARLVQDRSQQTAYHKQTGWQTTEDVVEKYGKQAVNLVKQALHNEVNS